MYKKYTFLVFLGALLTATAAFADPDPDPSSSPIELHYVGTEGLLACENIGIRENDLRAIKLTFDPKGIISPMAGSPKLTNIEGMEAAVDDLEFHPEGLGGYDYMSDGSTTATIGDKEFELSNIWLLSNDKDKSKGYKEAGLKLKGKDLKGTTEELCEVKLTQG